GTRPRLTRALFPYTSLFRSERHLLEGAARTVHLPRLEVRLGGEQRELPLLLRIGGHGSGPTPQRRRPGGAPAPAVQIRQDVQQIGVLSFFTQQPLELLPRFLDPTDAALEERRAPEAELQRLRSVRGTLRPTQQQARQLLVITAPLRGPLEPLQRAPVHGIPREERSITVLGVVEPAD